LKNQWQIASSSALAAYRKEGILILRGKSAEGEILIDDLVIPPLATHGRGFSTFPQIMLPMDLRVIGLSHSHPSGALRPSTHDLNHFYRRIMIIAPYAFQTYGDIGVVNNRGERLHHEIVPDAMPQKGDDCRT
jgi:hypothetical protein